MRNVCAMLIATLLLSGQDCHAIIFSLTDLGDLGGGYSYGYAINEQGHATGVSKINAIDLRAFYWNGSTMQDIGTNPNGGPSFGFDINNNDEIAGKANEQAFRWDQGNGMVLVDPDHLGSANAITNLGAMSGERREPSSTSMVWSPNNIANEYYPNSRISGMNEANQLTGDLSSGSAFYAPNADSMTIAIPLTNSTDISNDRLITGSVTGSAALYDFDSDNLTEIGRLDPGDLFSMALGISPNGKYVVGTSGGTRAFIWDSTLGLQDVTSLLSEDYIGWTILAVEDINDRGQMIGVGRFNGVDHAVILRYIPEPSTEVLLCLGFALFVAERASRLWAENASR